MVFKSKIYKNDNEKADILLHNHNRRKLKIALETNCISREIYSEMRSILENTLNNGEQISFEDACSSIPSLKLDKITPIVNKELFKYHQIIIKLAQQFAKNTITQQLKFQRHDQTSIEQEYKKRQDKFAQILEYITNDYLSGIQINIDNFLLESGFIKESHLEFIHSSAEHLEIKAQDRKFGEIAVKNEFITQDIVKQALDEQTERFKKTNKNHIIGDILVEQNHITTETRDEILIIQNRILEEDWEDTLKIAGQSSIEEKEKNALFGALVLKENLLDEKQVVEALKIQAKELEEYNKSEKSLKPNKTETDEGINKSVQNLPKKQKPRWIGDILVENFGLSERDRKKIIKKQMEYKIERINLKLGLNLSSAHVELFNAMEQYFYISYSKDKIEAYIKVLKPVPKSMTKDNLIIWLYHKKIRYGRINSAVDELINNTVKPGKKILIARGDEPVSAEMTYKFFFDTNIISSAAYKSDQHSQNVSHNNQTRFRPDIVLPLIVKKGNKLITTKKIKGRSGLNVNRCFVAPPMGAALNIIKGENITKFDTHFEASCDGLPYFSDNRVISLFNTIYIEGDISLENMDKKSSIEFDCDFDIKGTVDNDVSIICRKLISTNFKGRAKTSDNTAILNETISGEINAEGNVYLSSVEQSIITSQKSIVIQTYNEDKNGLFNKIYNSIITSDDIIRINDAELLSSVIRAKNKIILKKVTVKEQCKFIVGDSIEVISHKKKIEAIKNDIDKLDADIKEVQANSRELFEKIEKKDIAAIEQEIRMLSKNTRTKDDVDRISQLRVLKRQKEKEYEVSVDQYGAIFMENSQKIKQYQDQMAVMEKEKKELENHIMSIYKKDKDVPELDIRRTKLPEGTIIQFRYNQQVLEYDCKGFVFREEFDEQTNRYEIKQQRW